MVWDGHKIRDLRLRMGWSQSDLARRLQVESQKINAFETELEITPKDIRNALDFLHQQADLSAHSVSCSSLAQIMFDEDELLQIDTSSIQRKFLDL